MNFLAFLSHRNFYKFNLTSILKPNFLIFRLYCFLHIHKGDTMAKGKDVQKSVKTAPAKSLKEKRADKKAKKDSK